jgi:hypothetical protein
MTSSKSETINKVKKLRVKGVETSNPDEEEVEKTFCSPD